MQLFYILYELCAYSNSSICSNHTVLSCMTAPSHHMGVFNVSLEQLFVSDVNDSYTCSLIYQTAEQFEYKKDPVVLGLEPNPPKTIKE